MNLQPSSSTTPAHGPADDHPGTDDTPIRDLIPGLDEIGALPIPYTRLPPRVHAAYADAFTHWADIANQTIESLRTHPGVGEAAVQALLAAATDAITTKRAADADLDNGPATALSRLLDRLDPRDRIILSTRVWAPHPKSQRALAEHLGVNPVSIQRNQPRAQARFAELLADPAHHKVTEYAQQLRHQLGPYAPADTVTAELRRLDVDPNTETAHALLYLAGPYKLHDGWFDNTTAAGRQQAAAAINDVLDRSPAPSTETLTRALTALGLPHDTAHTYLHSRNDLRHFGNTWVRWGHTSADKAEAVLHARGTPATTEDILETIGTNTITLRPFRDILNADPRFIRTSRTTWGLSTWNTTEYAGIFDEITARIDISRWRVGTVAVTV